MTLSNITDYPTKFYTFRHDGVPAWATVALHVQPHQIFKPHTFRFDGPPNTFRLKGFKVGRNDQFTSEIMFDHFRGPRPQDLEDILKRIANAAETIAAGAGDRETHKLALDLIRNNMTMLRGFSHNVVTIDTVQPAMFMSMSVVNVTGFPADFECVVHGYSVDGWL